MNGVANIRRMGFAMVLGSLSAASVAAEPGAADVGSSLEEIVVTAQKRSERIQDVPMSITAIDAAQIEAEGIRKFQDYAVRIPNLSFAYTSGAAALGQSISLRGIYGRGTTGLYLDETPLPGSIDPQVMDLERIEVLRGPQGTLYGARSMGGAVRLITNQPDAKQFSATVHAIGSYTDHGDENGTVDGVLNLPIVADRFAIRAFGFWDRQSGVFTRIASPEAPQPFASRDDIGALRRNGGALSARLQLLDDHLALTPRVVIQRSDENGRPYADVKPGSFVQNRMFDLSEPGTDDWNLYSFTARYSASFGQFTAVTSWFDRDFSDSEDASEPVSAVLGFIVPSLFRVTGSARSFVQELRFTSEFSGPVRMTLGAIYQDQDNGLTVPPNLVAGVGNLYSTQIDTGSVENAAYAEATLAPTSKLELTAGVRYFRNSVDFQTTQDGLGIVPGTFGGVQRENGFNPKFNVKYSFNDDVNVFATAAKGFRTGGVNVYSASLCGADAGALGISDADAASYKSDSLWSYELGVKSALFERRLIANAAVFHIDWTDIQQSVPFACGFSITQNAGKARSRGFELELQAMPFRDLTLGAGVGRTDALITDGGRLNLVPVGQPIQQVPDWTFTGSSDYRFVVGGLPLSAFASYSYVGSSISRLNALNGRRRAAYSLVNLRLAAEINNASVSVFADNILNKIGNLADVPPTTIEDPNRPRIAVSRPRTIGVDVRVGF
jgi:iron complex outermembrane recepter protein